jgi:hypothetical protein
MSVRSILAFLRENLRSAKRGAAPPRKDDDFLKVIGRAMGLPPGRKPRDKDHST